MPSINTILERDTARVWHPSISYHFHRLGLQRDTAEELGSLEEAALSESHLLTDAGVDTLGFGCTSGGFLRGYEKERDFKSRLEDKAGVPVETPGSALATALSESGAQRVVLVAPYAPWLMERAVKYLGDSGARVLDASTFDLIDGHEIAGLTPTKLANKAERLASSAKDLDCVVLMCTAMRGMEAVEVLHTRGIPAVSSNQALLWSLNTKAGADVNPGIPGLLPPEPTLPLALKAELDHSER